MIPNLDQISEINDCIDTIVNMSPPMRAIGSSSSGSGGGGGVVRFVKSLYRDEFRWSLVKSVGLFALGIAIARDNDDVNSLEADPSYEDLIGHEKTKV